MKKIKKAKNLIIQLSFILAIIIGWQLVYNSGRYPELMFPSLGQIFEGLVTGFTEDGLGAMVLHSLKLILEGLGIGVLLAFVFSGLSAASKSFYAVYNMIVSVCDLLPGVALLPLAILWIGIGEGTIIFLVIHSVIWPMSRSLMDGFMATPRLYIEAGKNIGLNRFSLITGVYIPASFARILSGVKVGWARAWRGLISAEMIFGATSSGSGIGWFISQKRSYMDIPGVFAALIVIIVIGLVIEYGLFHWIEKYTVKKWGMTR